MGLAVMNGAATTTHELCVTMDVVASLGIGLLGRTAEHVPNIPNNCQTISQCGCATVAFSHPYMEVAVASQPLQQLAWLTFLF